MNYWLVKSEPSTYSWSDLVRERATSWDGVRNYTARNNLKQMQKGDLVLFYHSVKETAIFGLAKVTKEHYPDPTTEDDRWVSVQLEAVKALKKPVTLETIKAHANFDDMALVKYSRLSVQPVKDFEFEAVLKMGETTL